MAGVAVLGGSFNPIHYGHLLLADDVLELLGLDRLLFVPAAAPPHKPAAQLAPAADRFEMVRLAIAGQPRFAVSDLELRRRVREGRSLAFRLPPAVIDYVRAHGLYRAEPA